MQPARAAASNRSRKPMSWNIGLAANFGTSPAPVVCRRRGGPLLSPIGAVKPKTARGGADEAAETPAGRRGRDGAAAVRGGGSTRPGQGADQDRLQHGID